MAASRRHAAPGGRIATAGLSASATLGMVAIMAAAAHQVPPTVQLETAVGPPASTPDQTPTSPSVAALPPPVVIVKRRYIHVPAAGATPVARSAPEPTFAQPRTAAAAPPATTSPPPASAPPTARPVRRSSPTTAPPPPPPPPPVRQQSPPTTRSSGS